MAAGNQDRIVSSLRDKEASPFTPGTPVPPELFVGRSHQIESLQRSAQQACSGRQENVFLAGDRGIGKSSLAHFLRELCAKRFGMIGVHAVLTEVDCLEEMTRRIFDQLLKAAHTQPWFDRIRGLFGKYVKDVGLFGVSVTFAPPERDLRSLVREFPAALNNVWRKMGDQKRGLLIVLDDINGLACKKVFADWYKSFVDHVATQGWETPVLMMLCGVPEVRDTLSDLQPSLMRIFHVVDIERLSDEDVADFFRQAFHRKNVAVDADAVRTMMHFSSGLPALMHEIGDAAYWLDTDGRIDRHDAVGGIASAAEEVGRKYLDPRVYRAIRSERYRAILGKVASSVRRGQFTKRQVEEKLNAQEKRVFGNFLRRMRDLGVIEPDPERGRGSYRFVNRIFPVYISMQSRA